MFMLGLHAVCSSVKIDNTLYFIIVPFFSGNVNRDGDKFWFIGVYRTCTNASLAKPSLPKGGGTVADGGRIPEGDRGTRWRDC